jgi:hypothetical protein
MHPHPAVGYAPTHPLTESQMNAVDGAMSPDKLTCELVEAFNRTILGADLQCLHPGGWLNDEVLNCYFELVRRQLGVGRPNDAVPKIYIFNTHFYNKLVEMGTYDYARVRKWTARTGACDLCAMDMVFFPVGNGVHWTLAVAFVAERKIKYYDSKGGAGRSVLRHLLAYLDDEWQKTRGEGLDRDAWELVSTGRGVPQQLNNDDCGVFMSFFLTYLAQGRPLTFSQTDMPHFRKLIALSILAAMAPPAVFAALADEPEYDRLAGAGIAAGVVASVAENTVTASLATVRKARRVAIAVSRAAAAAAFQKHRRLVAESAAKAAVERAMAASAAEAVVRSLLARLAHLSARLQLVKSRIVSGDGGGFTSPTTGLSLVQLGRKRPLKRKYSGLAAGRESMEADVSLIRRSRVGPEERAPDIP